MLTIHVAGAQILVINFRNLSRIRIFINGENLNLVGSTPNIFVYMVGTCRLKTQGMLACTGLRRINYGYCCGRKDIGPYMVSEVVWDPIDQYRSDRRRSPHTP